MRFVVHVSGAYHVPTALREYCILVIKKYIVQVLLTEIY